MKKPRFRVHPDTKSAVEKHIAPMFTKEQRAELDKGAKFLCKKLKLDGQEIKHREIEKGHS